jgi:hypothetical protein
MYIISLIVIILINKKIGVDYTIHEKNKFISNI